MADLRLAVDSTLDAVAAAAEAVRTVCREGGVADSEAALVELALVEALTNAVEHGHAGRAGSRIELSLHVDEASIEAELHDRGAPVDPRRVAVPAPEAPGPVEREALSERGRGLQIIRGVFDEVRFTRLGDVNRLSLRRRRTEPRV